MKDVFTDQEIALKTRVKLAESMVRSRLTYAVQSERLSSAQRSKIDSINNNNNNNNILLRQKNASSWDQSESYIKVPTGKNVK